MEPRATASIPRSNVMPSFEEAMPLGPGDEDFVRDVVAVLAKYNNLQRFGLCLLHEHFPLDDDEIMMETHDTEARTYSLRAVRMSEVEADTKWTSWSLANMQAGVGSGPRVLEAMPIQGCAQDKCKVATPLKGCAHDKCKEPTPLKGCAHDKCKEPTPLKGCAHDKCK